MSKLLSLVVVVAVLSLVIWLRPDDVPLPKAGQEPKQEGPAATSTAADALGDVSLQAIESDLLKTGFVVRRRSSQTARAAPDATESARTTAAIEAQLARDPRLSALRIDVDTSDGLVTLSGRVESATDLARAIDIALTPASVRQVVSTLQIARPAPASAP